MLHKLSFFIIILCFASCGRIGPVKQLELGLIEIRKIGLNETGDKFQYSIACNRQFSIYQKSIQGFQVILFARDLNNTLVTYVPGGKIMLPKNKPGIYTLILEESQDSKQILGFIELKSDEVYLGNENLPKVSHL